MLLPVTDPSELTLAIDLTPLIEDSAADIAAFTTAHLRRKEPAIVSWDVLEFIARVVDHIPEPSQQMTLYRGSGSVAVRQNRQKLMLKETPPQAPSKAATGEPSGSGTRTSSSSEPE